MSNNLIVYSYLKTSNPYVQWEVAIGRIRSACDYRVAKTALSVWHFSYFRKLARNGEIQIFRNELLLESIRDKYYPNAVSRLRGVFFFESEQLMKDALQRWKLPATVGNNTSEIRFSANNFTRVDSEWITHNLALESTDESWMHSYWSGETYGDRPLTEIIASGIGKVSNIELRQECYRNIYNNTPLATPILSMGATAFHGGVESAMQAVAQLSRDGDTIRSSGYVSTKDFEDLPTSEWAEIRERCTQEGALFPQHPESQNSEIFQIPELVQNFEFDDEMSALIIANGIE